MPEISVNHADQLRKLSIRAEANGDEALGGSVDMKDFVNLEELEISNHGISSIKNYRPEQLEVFKVQNNNIKDELPEFGDKLRILQIFNDDTCTPLGSDLSSNSFTGDLRSIIKNCKNYLNVVDARSDNPSVKNNLSGLLPKLNEYTKLREFDVSDNVSLGGSIGDLSQCSFLTKFRAHNTSITSVEDDFDVPETLKTFSLYNTPITSDSVNLIVDKLYAEFDGTDVTDGTIDIGPAGLLTDTSLTRLNELENDHGWNVTLHSDTNLPLLNNNFAKEPTLALGCNKLTASASLAFRMRRGWDDVEIDVGFDSDGKVSNSSPVSNASNGKTYVTAGDFLTEVFTQPYAEPVVATNSSLNLITNFSASTNEDGTYNFSATAAADGVGDGSHSGAGRLVFVPKAGTPLVQEKDTARTQFKFSGVVTSTDTRSKYIIGAVGTTDDGSGNTFYFTDSNSTDNPRPVQSMPLFTTSGALGAFEYIRSGANDAATNGVGNYFVTDLGQIQVSLGHDGTSGENVSVTDFKVEVIKHSGCVTKWYDQSPNNYEFTQTNKDNQPFIAMDGLMLDSVRFGEVYQSDFDSPLVEGTDFLEAPTGEKIITGTHASDFSIFTVYGLGAESDSGYLFGNGHDANTGHNVYAGGNSSINLSLGFGATTNATRFNASSDLGLLNDLKLASLINDGDGNNFVNVSPNVSGTLAQNSGSVTTVSAATSDFIIGNRPGGTADATRWKGKLKEIVIYDGSDKTVERKAIEAEIIRRNELT